MKSNKYFNLRVEFVVRLLYFFFAAFKQILNFDIDSSWRWYANWQVSHFQFSGWSGWLLGIVNCDNAKLVGTIESSCSWVCPNSTGRFIIYCSLLAFALYHFSLGQKTNFYARNCAHFQYTTRRLNESSRSTKNTLCFRLPNSKWNHYSNFAMNSWSINWHFIFIFVFTFNKFYEKYIFI